MVRSDVLTRKLAHRLISRVVLNGCTLDQVFRSPAFNDLKPADVRFVRLLVLTVLRNYFRLNALLKIFFKKELSLKQADIRIVLLIGIAELVYLRMPSYAAVNTAVELVKSLKRSGFAGLVNAVLRSCVRRIKEVPDLLSTYKSLPDWLWSDWEKTYGSDRVKRISDFISQEPPLDLTVMNQPLEWAKKLNGSLFFPNTVRLKSGPDVSELCGYREGAWWVQNAAASVPVFLFTALSGKSVADLCAAPGGKTAQLASLGAFVDAFDISNQRLNRLRENMKRLGFEQRVHIVCSDLTTGTIEKKYDAVLLDAPCSATGTLNRHPDMMFHRTQEDVLRLAKMQSALLDKAAEMLKTGGELVYSVCSLQIEEGEEQIRSFLKRHPSFCVIEPTADFLTPFKTSENFIRLTPLNETDGFFAVLLRRCS